MNQDRDEAKWHAWFTHAIQECGDLVERILASGPVRRSNRLRDFLLYICKRSLQDHCEHILEQEIGAEVFGRAYGYDTGANNIVRINATELRKRLDAYFTGEGAEESLILEIPRGAYRPVFSCRHAEKTPGQIVPEAQGEPSNAEMQGVFSQAGPKDHLETSHGIPQFYRLSLFVATPLCVALLALCIVLKIENRSVNSQLHQWAYSEDIACFWEPFLRGKANTDLILADTTFALVEDITQQRIP